MLESASFGAVLDGGSIAFHCFMPFIAAILSVSIGVVLYQSLTNPRTSVDESQRLVFGDTPRR
jgi:hypothetical protein